MKKLKAHPLADRLPEMTAEEFEGLKASIAENGQRDAIVLLKGQILDGRHRYRACIELGLEPRIVDFKASWGDPVRYVIDKAMHRHMTSGQKAVAAEAFMDDLVDQRDDCVKGRSADVAGKFFGVSGAYVEHTRAIRKSAPKLYEELRAGKLNVSQAYNRYKQVERSKAVRKLTVVKKSGGIPTSCDLRLGDVNVQLKAMGDESVDLIFTDPPYNIGIEYHRDETADSRTDSDFLKWCNSWLDQLTRIAKPHASLFLMMTPRYAWPIASFLHAFGWTYRNTIAWHETFGSYNEGNLTECWRAILYFTRHATNFTWNNDVRVESARQAVYGDARANPAGKVPGNVWSISRVQGTSNERVPFADAPPQIPIEIPDRCVRLASNLGDVVLDPFNGNGTTAIAALKNGRSYIGIEKSPKYLDQSKQWIASQLPNSLPKE